MDCGCLSPTSGRPRRHIYLYENNHTCKLIISFRFAATQMNVSRSIVPHWKINLRASQIKNLDHK